MKKLLLSSVVFLSLMGSATANKEDLTGVVRSISMMAGVGAFCPEFFYVNKDKIEKNKESWIDYGVTKFGKDAFTAAMTKELDRRYEEIEITGTIHWCEYMKAFLESLHFEELFKESKKSFGPPVPELTREEYLDLYNPNTFIKGLGEIDAPVHIARLRKIEPPSWIFNTDWYPRFDK